MIAPAEPADRWRQTRSLILRWLITTLAIFAAVYLVPGITFAGPGWELGLVAAVFGLVNIGLLLLLTSWIASNLGVQFTIDGFWPAFWGGLIISIVTMILTVL